MNIQNEAWDDEFSPESSEKKIRDQLFVEVRVKEVTIHQSDSEYLIADMIMTNGDTIKIDSFMNTSPNPNDVEKNYLKVEINHDKCDILGRHTNQIEESVEEFVADLYRDYLGL